jgi:hypothetical protein
MSIPTTALRAKEVMERTASLMNDTARTTYTYDAVLPYLNMAIDELQEELQLRNMSPTNQSEIILTLTAGLDKLTPQEDAVLPHYPFDLVEIREIKERLAGTSDTFTKMNRRDFLNTRVPTSDLIDWCWENQYIKFYSGGATTNRDLLLEYVRQPLQMAQNENSLIGIINSRAYLAFKTAAFCARYIGENESRSNELHTNAGEALDRLLGIGTKGRQNMQTRRRPFRSSYKLRGWY